MELKHRALEIDGKVTVADDPRLDITVGRPLAWDTVIHFKGNPLSFKQGDRVLLTLEKDEMAKLTAAQRRQLSELEALDPSMLSTEQAENLSELRAAAIEDEQELLRPEFIRRDLRLEQDLNQRLTEKARRQRLSGQQVMVHALEAYLGDGEHAEPIEDPRVLCELARLHAETEYPEVKAWAERRMQDQFGIKLNSDAESGRTSSKPASLSAEDKAAIRSSYDTYYRPAGGTLPFDDYVKLSAADRGKAVKQARNGQSASNGSSGLDSRKKAESADSESDSNKKKKMAWWDPFGELPLIGD